MADWLEMRRMDELALQDTPMHRLDARVKAAATLGFVVVVMSFPTHEITALLPLLLYPVLLIAAGRIPLRHILRKIIVAAPFAFFIAVFNPILDRAPAAALGPVVISRGWLSFSSIMLRFVLTVGAALALIACTGMYKLCTGLTQLGMPRIFAIQTLFLYRYLFVAVEEGIKTARAAASRGGKLRALPLKAYGSLSGHLLLRALARAERVYQAMSARGFAGEFRLLRRSRLTAAEWSFLAAAAAFFLICRIWNLPYKLGEALSSLL